jgi:phage-related protein
LNASGWNAVTPFANTFADALDGILKHADKFTQSKGFAGFLTQFQAIEGPAVTAIGEGIGKVLLAFGKLLTTMSAQDVARTIGIAFNTIAGIIDGVAGIVHRLMQNWDQMSSAAKRSTHDVASAFDDARRAVATFGHDTASRFDGIRHDAARFGDSIASGVTGALATARHAVATFADDVVKWFEGLPGRIKGVFGQIFDPAAMSSSLAKMDPVIGHAFASAFATLRHDAAAAFDDIAHNIASRSGQAASAAVSAFNGMRHGVAAAADGARHDIAAAFGAMPSIVGSALSAVWNVLNSVGGKIQGIFADAGSWLINAGRAIIDGLISGIESNLGKLAGILANVATFIAEHKGPLDYDRQLLIPHGQAIMQGLITGIDSSRPALRAQLAAVSRDIGVSAHAGPAAGGGAVYNITINGPIDKHGTAREIHQLLRDYKRTGGNIALGLG